MSALILMRRIIRGAIAVNLFFAVLITFPVNVPASTTDDAIDKATQSAIVDSVASALIDHYVFPKMGREMAEAIKSYRDTGKYDTIMSPNQFVTSLSSYLRSFSNDRHIRISVIPPEGFDIFEADTVGEDQIASEAARNFGFRDVRILPGNIGYLELREFVDPSYAGNTAAGAMAFLANCDAMIVDLRGNGGGTGSMVNMLASYFFDEPQPLNSLYSHETDSITQRWTMDYLPGVRLADIDLYILADRYSASAAEDFIYSLHCLKRATVIGQTTAGAANTVDFYPFPSLGILARISTGYPINPVTGDNWEGRGIAPDIETSSEEALKTAHYTALKKLAEQCVGEQSFELDWALEAYKAEFNPISLDKKLLKSYAGNYGKITIRYDNGDLYYQRDDEKRIKMIPLSDNLFRLDEMEYMRLKFITEETGRSFSVQVIFDDGYINSYFR